MFAPRRVLLAFVPAATLACGDANVAEPAAQPEAEPQEACPQWLLVERDGGFPTYERLVYDDQARVVRREMGGPARSSTGEVHSTVEISYEDGLVTLESERRDSLGQESSDDFTEVTELDSLGRPTRILGWDLPQEPVPNRTATLEYDVRGRLSVRHQQDEYANGVVVDRRCTFEYDAAGQLDARICAGTQPDAKRWAWDEDGNLSFSELEAEAFTSRAEYAYEGGRLSMFLAEDFSRDDFAYDNEGRLVWHAYTRFDGLGGGVDEFAYDPQGRLALHVSKGTDGAEQNSTSFLYDAEGRLIEEVSDATPRSYQYALSEGGVTVTERWGDEVFETRAYVCSPTATTGMPVETNPEPFGGRDRVLPHQTVTPLPFPEVY